MSYLDDADIDLAIFKEKRHMPMEVRTIGGWALHCTRCQLPGGRLYQDLGSAIDMCRRIANQNIREQQPECVPEVIS